jgi:hypothetical protein
LAGAAVAHLEEEFDDEAFEEIGRGGLDAGEEIGGEGAPELGVGGTRFVLRGFLVARLGREESPREFLRVWWSGILRIPEMC